MSDFQSLLSRNFLYMETDIREACSVFFHALGFNYFDFTRFYPDSTFVTFISNPLYSDFFFNYSKYEKHTVYTLPTSYLPTGKHLWTSYIDAPFLSLANQQFKHGLGLTLVRHCDDYVELANFAAPSNTPDVLDVFVNHTDILDTFIVYFTEKFSSFLKNKKNRIFLPDSAFQKPQKTELASVLDSLHEELLTEIKKIKKMGKKQIPILTGNTIVNLSLREFDCLNELRKGISSKEIARNLGISYRTVELYCAKLMEKMNVNKRTKLFDKMGGNAHPLENAHPSKAVNSYALKIYR